MGLHRHISNRRLVLVFVQTLILQFQTLYSANELVPSFFSYCPFTNSCQKENAQDSDYRSANNCCHPYCSCDLSTCKTLGNCCPDVGDIGKPITDKCLSAMYQTFQGPDDGLNMPGRYFVMDECPDGYEDVTVVRKCTGYNHKKLDETWFVSSVDNRLVFRNKYCALCHGVTQYNNWKLGIYDCGEGLDEMKTSTLTNMDQLIMEHCKWFSFPPNNAVGNETRCFIAHYNKCNQTGQWDSYNETIELGCNLYKQPYFYKKRTAILIFENVYCYLCNENVDFFLPEAECRIEELSDIRDGNEDEELSLFSTILDFRKYFIQV